MDTQPETAPEEPTGRLAGATATYSPEDNKLRLYPLSRLSRDDYEQVKRAGFQWAPKQELFVASAWTPAREDLLIELCGEIGDEDYSATERAADRAERFSDYRDKRRAEAGDRADRFDSGPAAFGHQNRQRAERQAARHDRHRICAVSQWAKAEYWQDRTAAVIGHALYKSSAAVRRSRIKRLEAEQRKHEKERAEHAERFANWQQVPTLEGADRPGRYISKSDYIGFDPESVTPALRAVYNLANSGYCGLTNYPHPRSGIAASLYTHLTDQADPITPAEAASLWLERATDPADPESRSARWSDHYANRLAYERAMLAAEGGSAADAEMEPGGWIGKHQIHAVNRSPVTKRVVSVKLMAPKRWHHGPDAAPLVLQSFNIERLPEGAYRAPTDAERAAFAQATQERKAQAKATKPKAPQLVNPTDADAQRLQDLWNARAEAIHDKAKAEGRLYGEYTPTAVRRITQAQYSANSGGAYSRCETVEVCANGHRPRRWHDSGSTPEPKYPVAFKVRKTYGGGGFTAQADAVIVITDKPQKPLPLDWEAIAAGTTPSSSFQPATSSAEATPATV